MDIPRPPSGQEFHLLCCRAGTLASTCGCHLAPSQVDHRILLLRYHRERIAARPVRSAASLPRLPCTFSCGSLGCNRHFLPPSCTTMRESQKPPFGAHIRVRARERAFLHDRVLWLYQIVDRIAEAISDRLRYSGDRRLILLVL